MSISLDPTENDSLTEEKIEVIVSSVPEREREENKLKQTPL